MFRRRPLVTPRRARQLEPQRPEDLALQLGLVSVEPVIGGRKLPDDAGDPLGQLGELLHVFLFGELCPYSTMQLL